jgi:4-hydroxythreonine-4-phosphate dehydrogenase
MALALAVSLGDPAGVGPELITAAWDQRLSAHVPPFFVVGGAAVLREAALQRGLNVPIIAITDPEEASTAFASGLPVLIGSDGDYTPGMPDHKGAELALTSLSKAVALTVKGSASGLVTAPIAKSRLALVGFTHTGQTEFVADACSVRRDSAVMMLAGPQLRTVPLTVHVALAAVPSLITTQLITHKAKIISKALIDDFDLPHPRLAIAALNPHAGEDGLFGTEDSAIIAPAIAQLQAEGIAASGPHSADALFAPHARAGYDVALCMYHDQALIPIKALDFDAGVNVTFGLPIIRTSPDHGTAFAIAGTGTANPGAMIAAIRMAGECASRRACA